MAVVEAIATIRLESDVTSVTFSSLGSYEHLQLRVMTIGNAYNALKNGMFYLNGDTTDSNYHRQYTQGGSTTAFGNSTTGSSMWGLAPKADSTPTYGPAIIDILDYRNPNKNTSVMSFYGGTHPNGGSPDPYLQLVSSMWDNTAAVTSIQLLPQSEGFTRGSSFNLYGWNSS